MVPNNNPLLEICDLSVSFGATKAVKGVSLSIPKGKIVGIVGESGSGKSLTALAIMRLLPQGCSYSGRIVFEGKDLLSLDESQMRAVRGAKISMVFQDAQAALNPTMPIGEQVAEMVAMHSNLKGKEVRERVLELLEQVGISDPARRYSQYPFEFSGGMKQRVMIAIALAAEPLLLIADEPTTALDVTTQAQILDLLKSIQTHRLLTILFISHHLGIVSQLCDEVYVMEKGHVVEGGHVRAVFDHPQHPYTQRLLSSVREFSNV